MGKTISEIYSEYKIMPNLQEHMLRVTAVASMVCDNMDVSVKKEEIITACLLHDMGNIIKSKFEFMPEFFEPEGREYWEKVKKDFINKYTDDEEEANRKIARELGMSPRVIFLISQDSFSLLCKHRDSDDIDVKIMHYADTRVAPYGIVSFDARLEEAKRRYKLATKAEEEEREKLAICGREMEKQIFSKCKIKPEDINDQSAAPIISKLRDFVIHSA